MLKEHSALQQIIHLYIPHAFEEVGLEGGIALGKALDFFADGFTVARLGKFTGAGELADACVFGILDNLRFFAVA